VVGRFSIAGYYVVSDNKSEKKNELVKFNTFQIKPTRRTIFVKRIFLGLVE
jgi:hypothetical protein